MNRIAESIFALIFSTALLCATASAQRSPNVVLLIGDDHGYPYFGFMGDENVVTPSMDALVAGGVTFTGRISSAKWLASGQAAHCGSLPRKTW